MNAGCNLSNEIATCKPARGRKLAAGCLLIRLGRPPWLFGLACAGLAGLGRMIVF
jgi:hypothetical protein